MISIRRIAAAGAVILLSAPLCLPQGGDEDHKASIRGIEIGMNAGQVLDKVGRMPDSRKDDKDEVSVFWKVEADNILQVRFHKERVSHIALQYKRPRPTTELWLQPLYTAPGSSLTGRDPRLRVDYKSTETVDKLRAAWTRDEKTAAGYQIQVQFLSGSRKNLGERFADFVEFKYVTVPRDEIGKFEKAAAK